MNNPIDEVSQAERRRIIENDRKVMATRGMLSLAAWVRLKFSGVSNASNCPLR
jgi:hypothetical protein